MTDFARVLARTDETTWVECPECERAVEAPEIIGSPGMARLECDCGFEGVVETTTLPF